MIQKEQKMLTNITIAVLIVALAGMFVTAFAPRKMKVTLTHLAWGDYQIAHVQEAYIEATEWFQKKEEQTITVIFVDGESYSSKIKDVDAALLRGKAGISKFDFGEIKENIA